MDTFEKSLALFEQFLAENDEEAIRKIMDKFDAVGGESISLSGYFAQSSRNNWLGQHFVDDKEEDPNPMCGFANWVGNGVVTHQDVIPAASNENITTFCVEANAVQYQEASTANIKYAA